MSRVPVPQVLPAAFCERLARLVAAHDLPGVLDALAHERLPSVRVNTLRGDPSDVVDELLREGIALRPVAGLPEAFVLDDRAALRALQASAPARRGALFVQGLSSQLAAPALDPRPGETILDLAAAPGGKTCHLAARMGDHGRLLANDRSRTRVFRLRAVLQEQGVRCAEVTCRPGETFARSHPGGFDRVLLDAPCSAEARLRGTPPDPSAEAPLERRPRGRRAKAARRASGEPLWSLPRIKRLAGQQQRLLMAALDAARPGGVVVYATCTLAPEENEAVLDRVLRAREGEVVLEELPPQGEGARPGVTAFGGREFLPELGRAVRILPGPDRDAFFLARLRRLPA
ncbi:MAG: RsmB/NOP family class I SAM-dependent RNA methyltransferase [Planctomycetes bacterium]|nr:RsmB/NOP family class I SAM-dependent RNA methyltransferase [Planctomycetota bacterium]